MENRFKREAKADFEKLKGSVVLLLRASGKSEVDGRWQTVNLDPPAVARIASASAAGDADVMMVSYGVDLLAPHPDLDGMLRISVKGGDYGRTALMERRDFVKAVPELAERYASVPALTSDKELRRKAAEEAAWAEYETVAGKIVLLTEVGAYDDRGSSVTIVCDPPAVGRIARYSDPKEERLCVLRWMDEDALDPVYDIEILEPHAAFAEGRPSWVYGTSRYTDHRSGETRSSAFEVAPLELAALYIDAPALAEKDLVPRPERILASYVRMYVPTPGGGLDREEEFDSIPFDATEAVLALDLAAIRALADGRDATDVLVPDGDDFRPLGGPRGGGTDVRVAEAIKAFFGVSDLAEIDADMLDEARRAHGMEIPSFR